MGRVGPADPPTSARIRLRLRKAVGVGHNFQVALLCVRLGSDGARGRQEDRLGRRSGAQ